jgi:D-alanyl-D-alanine carboxypeptidase
VTNIYLGDPVPLAFPVFFALSPRRIAPGICLALVALAGICHAAERPGHRTPLAHEQQLKAALHQDLADYLSKRSSIEHISTLSLAVTFRDKPEIITDAVGTTSYGGGKPVTPNNLFQIGSNTKAFTSVLLLHLEARGVLSIDDKLQKWLPQYPAWGNATIRQLLNMTSGIPTYDASPGWNKAYNDNPHRTFTPEQLVGYVYPTIKTVNPKWEYSNTGYILAQMIIEKASPSHSYKTEIDRLIAQNHLRDTFYESDFYPEAVNRRLVSGYYVNTDDKDLDKLLNTDTSRYSLGWAQGAGGLVSTPLDLARWVRALFEGNVLARPQKEELESLVSMQDGTRIAITSEKVPVGFGLGVGQKTNPPMGTNWFYQGSTIGYRAVFIYVPESGLIISVFTNSQAAHAVSLVDKDLAATLYNTLQKYTAGGLSQ